MLHDIKGVLFDLDGTLIDSMWVWKEVDEKYVHKYGLKEPEGFYQTIEGMSFMETARYYQKTFPQLNRTPEEIGKEWFQMVEAIYEKEVTLKKGAGEFLARLKQHGIKIGIATSNIRELAESVLEAQKVLAYFDVICTSGEVNAGKPEPDVYLKAAEKLKLKPQECLVFEDVPNGILAGKRAGMKVCAVEDSFTSDVWEEKKKLADYAIKDYTELYINF